MSDPNRGKYKKYFLDEFRQMEDYLIILYNGSLTWSEADYEAFCYKTDDIRLIFYPHKTSAGHYHIRVSDGGSKNKIRAKAIMEVIQLDMPNCSTFHQKNNHFSTWYSGDEKKQQEARKVAAGK
jgi:hypothetical protein